MMRILLLGDDGRAHALAWKLINSPRSPEVICAPGNGGTAPFAPSVTLDATDAAGLSRWTFEEQIDLVIPASSAPLHAGLVDEVLSLHIGVWGASRRAAALERSRCLAKEFMIRHGIPTAHGRPFTDLATAERYLATLPLPVMIKTDHPSGGEEIFDDRYAALEGLRRLFAARSLDGGEGVVIESALHGPRVALSALTDGRTAVPLLATRLYDRVEEGDRGAQARGIGAHASNSTFAQRLTRYLHEKFILPFVAGLEKEGLPCWGLIGVDCIITNEGPRATALRFSFREGEAQVVLPRLEDDLIPWIEASITRRLHELPPPTWTATSSVGLGLMARGYPNFFPTGGRVRGLEDVEPGVMVFHSATTNPAATAPYVSRVASSRGSSTDALSSMIGGLLGMGGTPQGWGGLRTTGGLVATVVAQGVSLPGARGRALVNADRVQFEGRTYRSDIGERDFG